MVTTRESRSESGKQGLDRLALAFDDERARQHESRVGHRTLVVEGEPRVPQLVGM